MRPQFWSSTTTERARRRALPSIIASALFGTTLIAIGAGSAPSLAGGAPADPVVTVVTAGKTHTCAVVDGSAYCWGSNGEYQLGNGVEYFYDYVENLNGGNEPTPEQIADYTSDGYNLDSDIGFIPFAVKNNSHSATSFVNSEVTALALGDYHTCALKGGSIYCWGSNGRGQLGLGEQYSGKYIGALVEGLVDGGMTEDEAEAEIESQYVVKGFSPDSGGAFRPIKLPNVPGVFTNTNVTAIAAGNDVTCAVASGSLYCWGDNEEDGLLGLGATFTDSYIRNLRDAKEQELVDGGFDGDARDEAERVIAAQYALLGYDIDVPGAFQPIKLPNATYESIDDGVNPPIAVPGFVNTGATSVSIGGYNVCAIVAGSAYCWGSPGNGALGDGRFRGSEIATPHFVGFNINKDDETPLTLIQQYFDNDNIVSIEAGAYHSCLIKEDTPGNGQVYCWGQHNALGLINPSAAASRSTFFDGIAMPTLVDNTATFTNANVESLSAGDGHTCVIAGGVTHCWGRNDSGQLGDGTIEVRAVATKVGVVSANSLEIADTPSYLNEVNARVSAGFGYTCVIVGGYLYCWGDNENGQLGEGEIGTDEWDNVIVTPVNRLSPTLVFRYPDPSTDDGGGGGGDNGGGDNGGGDSGYDGWNGNYQLPSGVMLPDTR